MQGHRNIYTFLVPGTLTANITATWTAAHDGRIQHLSGVASNDSDATLMLGISTDTNSILDAAVIGDSDVPVEKTRANFATANVTGAFSKGDILVLTVDFDGATGTAAQNLCVVITTLEG